MKKQLLNLKLIYFLTWIFAFAVIFTGLSDVSKTIVYGPIFVIFLLWLLIIESNGKLSITIKSYLER